MHPTYDCNPIFVYIFAARKIIQLDGYLKILLMEKILLVNKNDLAEIFDQKLEEFYAKLKGEPKESPKKLLSSQEVCKILNITLPTLIAYRKQGLLREIKVGRHVYFDKEEFYADLDNLQKGGKNESK